MDLNIALEEHLVRSSLDASIRSGGGSRRSVRRRVPSLLDPDPPAPGDTATSSTFTLHTFLAQHRHLSLAAARAELEESHGDLLHQRSEGIHRKYSEWMAMLDGLDATLLEDLSNVRTMLQETEKLLKDSIKVYSDEIDKASMQLATTAKDRSSKIDQELAEKASNRARVLELVSNENPDADAWVPTKLLEVL